MTTQTVEILERSQCWDLLREAAVGRLAVVTDGRPDIFPVNYVVDHGSVVFRTAEGSKLASSVRRPVAFEVDGVDLDTGAAWSVVVRGTANVVVGLHEIVEALTLPLYPWQVSPKPFFVRISAEELTGRRFSVARDLEGAHLPPPRVGGE